MVTTHLSTECPAWWDAHVTSHSGLLFHQSLWQRALREGFGYEPFYCWQESESGIGCTMASAAVKLPFLRLLYSSVPYGGILGAADHQEQFIRDLLPVFNERGIHGFRIVEPGQRDNMSTLGFTREQGVRHVVNLAGHDEHSFLESLRKSVRRDVRKSEREGITVEEARSEGDIAIVYELYEQTMARNRAAAKYPIGRFRAVVNLLAPRGLGAIFLAKYQGRTIAATTVVCSKDEVHTLQISHDHDYRLLCPNEALIFAALKWTMASGRVRFDFMGSPLEDAALQRFKEKWNAQPEPLTTYSKSLAPVRSRCWDAVRWAVNTPAGARMARWWQRKKK